MTRTAPLKQWWTAQEIAEATLPDMPDSRQGVDAVVRKLGWRGHPEFARRRSGRGGGWEYFWKLLPSRAQVILLRGEDAAPEQDARPERGEAWAYYEGLSEKGKKKAPALAGSVVGPCSQPIPDESAPAAPPAFEVRVCRFLLTFF